MLSQKNTHQYIITATVLFTLITGLLVFIHPSAIFPDPSWGFQVLQGMRMGGHFNMLPSPDMDNLAKNKPSFLTWWSPGQYLVPYAFIKLFSLNIGQANALVATICSLCGIAGYYYCFKKIGFSTKVAAISIAFIACQEAYCVPFVFYNGGEVLLFAFGGWFLYGCISINKITWTGMLFILASGVIGFFCKSSFIWVFFSGGIYLWISLSTGKKITDWLRSGFFIGVPAVLALAIIYVAYLSKGDNPASDSDGLKLVWETFSFPLGAPLLAGFSVDDIANGLITHAGPFIFNPFWAVVVVLMLAFVSLALVIYIYKTIPYPSYKLLVVVFYVVAVLFFGISFLRQANISYESRHVRIIGLIITPGIIYLAGRLNTKGRAVFTLVWVFIAFITFRYLGYGYYYNSQKAAHGNTGIAQLYIDQPTLNYISDADKREQHAIFVFNSPALGLEIKRNRVITFDPLSDDLSADEDIYPYSGHAGPLYIVMPQTYTGAKASLYLSKFPGYHQFSLYKTSKHYMVYKGL